jgi:hypothetical protein
MDEGRRIEFDVLAIVRDGTVVRADACRLAAEGRYPVLLYRHDTGAVMDGKNRIRDVLVEDRSG